MNEPLDSLTHILSDVILPNLKATQQSQAEQIAANDRLEQAIEGLHTEIEQLRARMESQFAQLTTQLTACRAELAAAHALLYAVQEGASGPGRNALLN